MGTANLNLREQLMCEGFSPRTIEQYVRAIEAADWWCEERGYDLRTAPPGIIADYAATKPRSHSSRKLLRSALTHYWRLTKRRNPPVKVLRLPKKPKMVCRALEEDDARLLAKSALGREDKKGLVVLLTMCQALRREEIATLRWDAFKEDDTWLNVVGKGEKPAKLPVHPVVREALRWVPREGPYVFPGRVGGHVSPATIWEWHRHVANQAGVGAIPPHRGRHTCLATANDATEDLRAVQDFARHEDPETTSGYTRATARRLLAVINSVRYFDDLASERCATCEQPRALHRNTSPTACVEVLKALLAAAAAS